jgi:hypothetical protein
MSKLNNILNRFKKCTRCSCSTCLLNNETAAYQDQEIRELFTVVEGNVKDLRRRLYNTKGIAQFLAIVCALFTIVFYAKYGW